MRPPPSPATGTGWRGLSLADSAVRYAVSRGHSGLLQVVKRAGGARSQYGNWRLSTTMDRSTMQRDSRLWVTIFTKPGLI